ncbi:protein serine-threonine phosphatase [uncultured Candidatus Thioglobus sp.]|nr:protein serine-threonine phosphatase [uncultured Candidatus Thioglobus sp.]
MSKLIVYGDIHGCYDELVRFRQKIKPQKNDIEICVGDVITRGKDSIKALRYLQSNGIKSVIGNHEDKLIRYLKHQKKDKNNPITLDEDEKDIIINLNSDDIDFLQNMPLFLRFGKIIVLHGGLQNHQNLDKLSKKDRAKILRLRFVDENQNFVSFGRENEESIFWADVYDGNQGFIVYGHQYFKEVKQTKNTLGIDTGCVYGNKLSAVIFTNTQTKEFSIQSVKANVA